MGIVVITFLRVIRFLNFLGLEILVFLKEITYLKLCNLRIVYRSVPRKCMFTFSLCYYTYAPC